MFYICLYNVIFVSQQCFNNAINKLLLRTGYAAVRTSVSTWRPMARRILFWAVNSTDYRKSWTGWKLFGWQKPITVPPLLSFLPCNLFSRLVWRCIVAEPLRKSTATSRWRRIWVTVINTPTSWCSVMPANCFQTTKRLFTTSRENILFHGWGTRASWLIGRLNKLRPKHYANHLPCPLACFRIQGTSWEIVLQKLGNTCYSRRVYYLLPGSLFLDVPNRKCSVKFPK